MFLRRLIDLASSVGSLHHWIDLNSDVCADLACADLAMRSEFLRS